jgi:hypothetical protein
MARELTWHERRAINLRLQRRDGQLKRSRPNPSTGIAAAPGSVPAPHACDDDTPPAHEPLQAGADDDFPQPLKGFDYSFGAVG